MISLSPKCQLGLTGVGFPSFLYTGIELLIVNDTKKSIVNKY